MTKPVRSRGAIFGIPTVLALVTLAALVVGLIGGERLWPLAWVGATMPLATIIYVLKRRQGGR